MLTQYKGRIYSDLVPMILSKIKKNCSVEIYPMKQQKIQGKTMRRGWMCSYQSFITIFFQVLKSSYSKRMHSAEIESGRELIVLRRIRQFAQICWKISQTSSAEVEVQQKGAMQLAKDLHGRLLWTGANLSSRVTWGCSCRTFTICPICLSQMKISQILRIAYLKTKQTGFLRISFESDLIMCFHIFQQMANSTRLPEYSQKHSKYLRQTLTLSPLVDPKSRKDSISLAIFSPSTILFAFFSLSLRSESISAPTTLSGELRNRYFCLIWLYLETLRISCWKMKISESLTTRDCLILIDERNCRSELESQTYVTDSSSSSYYYSLRILLAILLNSFTIIYDHFCRQGSISGLESTYTGSLLVLFCRQLLINPPNFSSPPVRSNALYRSWIEGQLDDLFLSIIAISSLFACQYILLSFIRPKIDIAYSSFYPSTCI